MSNYTFDNLVSSAERLNPKVYGRNSAYVPKYEIASYTSGPERGNSVIVPYIGTKSVLVSLRAWGVTQASIHNITILFGDCDILTEDPNDRNYFSCMYEGKMYWIKKFDKHRNTVTFRCSCSNFFFVWAYSNAKHGVLYGPPPRPFKKKTNRPPVNARNLPGMCKHIFNAWALLRNSGLTLN